MKKILILSILLLCFTSYLFAEQKKGAKALFYSGEGPTIAASKSAEKKVVSKKSTVEKYMGIAYWIDLLKSDGKHIRTTAKRQFKSGDRIKLNLKSNKDGYLYVVNIGSTGSSRVLFPHSEHTNNFIKANETYAVPFTTYMKFDENPGEETLLVLLAPKEIKELFPSSPTIEAEDTNKYVAYANNKGAKDIVLEDDISTKSVSAQYAVAPMSSLENGTAISLFIKLKHK